MDDAAIRKRLDATLALLTANLLVVLGIGFKYATETTLGVTVLAALVGYSLVQNDGQP
jgi:hypothetical protein